MGVDPERLRLEWVSASEGIRFAEIMNDFAGKLKKLGPIGINSGGVKRKLDLAIRLVPYIKLVERERLRIPAKSAEAIRTFFAGDEVDRLIHELVLKKLELMQITSLLHEKPRSIGELSEALGLPASEVTKHLSHSARQGWTGFDESRKRFIRSQNKG